jgi:hypothetical protein
LSFDPDRELMPMPIFIAFAAFMLVVFAHQRGLQLPSWLAAQGFGAKRSRGQKSGVRTQYLEMVLDHDSGAMDGSCLRGHFAGKRLSTLSLRQLLSLLTELERDDMQGARLLEAYLDSQRSEWREHRSQQSHERQSKPGRGGLDEHEAYDVLGLKPGASRDEISKAHRRLMMKMHPDKGGSVYLASRINQARDTLLART